MPRRYIVPSLARTASYLISCGAGFHLDGCERGLKPVLSAVSEVIHREGWSV